jgi:hypothetical protein
VQITFFKNKAVQNEGFSVMELLIGLGISSFATLGIVYYTTSLSQNMKSVQTKSALTEVRNTLREAIMNDEAFIEGTIKASENQVVFSCLNNSLDCRDAEGEFAVYDKNVGFSARVVDYASLSVGPSATKGFNSRGEVCNSFGVDRLCPFKYVTRWAAVCPNSTGLSGGASIETACRNPIFDIRAQFLVSSLASAEDQKLASAQSNLNLRITRSQQSSDLASLCALISGAAYVGNECVLPGRTIATCDANFCGAAFQTFVIGFNDDGSPRCGCNVLGGHAGFGGTITYRCSPEGSTVRLIMLGIDSAGNPICGDGLVSRMVAGNGGDPSILTALPEFSFNPAIPGGDGSVNDDPVVGDPPPTDGGTSPGGSDGGDGGVGL